MSRSSFHGSRVVSRSGSVRRLGWSGSRRRGSQRSCRPDAGPISGHRVHHPTAPGLLARAHEGDPPRTDPGSGAAAGRGEGSTDFLSWQLRLEILADLKTPFTHGHSKDVARLAKAAAVGLKLDSETVDRLHVAGFLHDLGRVGISDAIWEKPGPLTGAEWEQVRLHVYHSERILATSQALGPVALIAGRHHERLDGSGYHRGSRAGDLPSQPACWQRPMYFRR